MQNAEILLDPFRLSPYSSAPLQRSRCNEHGEVSEWLKEHAWKVCIREIVSRVRTFSFGATHPVKGNELRLRCH